MELTRSFDLDKRVRSVDITSLAFCTCVHIRTNITLVQHTLNGQNFAEVAHNPIMRNPRLLSLVYLLLFWCIFYELLAKNSFYSTCNFLIQNTFELRKTFSGYLTSAFTLLALFSSFVYLFTMTGNASDGLSFIGWRSCLQVSGLHSHPDNHDGRLSLAISIVLLAAILM